MGQKYEKRKYKANIFLKKGDFRLEEEKNNIQIINNILENQFCKLNVTNSYYMDIMNFKES